MDRDIAVRKRDGHAANVIRGSLSPRVGEDPLDERGGLAPVVAHLVEQVRGVDDRSEAVVLAERHRLVPQQRDAGVVDVVAARRGLELLAAELPARRRQVRQDRLELGAVRVVVDRRADGGEPVGRSLVEADADPHAGRADLHVVAGGRAGRR